MLILDLMAARGQCSAQLHLEGVTGVVVDDKPAMLDLQEKLAELRYELFDAGVHTRHGAVSDGRCRVREIDC